MGVPRIGPPPGSAVSGSGGAQQVFVQETAPSVAYPCIWVVTDSSGNPTGEIRSENSGAYPVVDDLGIPASLIDALGDLVVGTGNDTAARLPTGTTGQVLAVNTDGSLHWIDAPTGGGSGSRRPSSTRRVTSSSPARQTRPRGSRAAPPGRSSPCRPTDRSRGRRLRPGAAPRSPQRTAARQLRRTAPLTSSTEGRPDGYQDSGASRHGRQLDERQPGPRRGRARFRERHRQVQVR
jgi:hypothetical protein